MTLPWPQIIHGLQLACAVIWLYPVFDRFRSAWRMLTGRDVQRWDAAWAAFWWVAVTQEAFCWRWVLWPPDLATMAPGSVKLWAIAYLSLAASAVGMVWTQGLTAGPKRNRQAMMLHTCTVLICVAGATVIG